MVSLWEQQSFLKCDVIVVGAGISGLSTAASLKEKNPDLDILVIERGTLPTGASTRNAGFACFGSISELANDRKALGDDGMVKLVKRRWDGLQKTIQRLGTDKIDLQQKGGYELLSKENDHFTEQIDEVNQLLAPHFDRPVFELKNDRIKEFGFRHTSQMIFNPFEGQLDTGKLMKSLWQYCSEKGILLITGTKVTNIEKKGEHTLVSTDQHQFLSKKVALCTNAFTSELTPKKLDISPGRGILMVVKPKKKLPFAGTFHYDEGYYYFRDYQDLLIFGGGRNLALEEERTTDFAMNIQILERLKNDLQERILPGVDHEIVMQWAGIMAFGANKQPVIEALSPGIFLGVRLGGMGVAIGSLVGEELSELILNDQF